MSSHARTAAISALALTLGATGCFGGSGKTKVGGKQLRQVTLFMQTPDAPAADAEYFIQQVKERTNGRIRIVEGGNEYSSRDPDNEARLVRALRSGKEQMAYIPSRAWERASTVTSFRALQAPFLVTDYTLLRRITTGSIGASMLKSLGRIDVIGLGLVPDELRRPLGRKPLVSAAAFRDAKIRVVTSPTGVLVLRSLGAVPLTSFTSNQVGPALQSGRLDGVESSTKSIADNNYEAEARYLPANIALFAKTQTIAIRRDVFARLGEADQAVLRAAAAAAVAHANPAAEEQAEVEQLCTRGMRVVPASPDALASLRRAAQPAYAKLERDAATAAAIEGIQRLAEHERVAALAPCQGSATASSTGTPFPQGRFESMLTEADFARAGAQRDPNFPEPWQITIEHGRWRTNEHPSFGGHYILHGDEITFVIERPADAAGERETVKWSYYRGELTLRIVSVRDAGARVIYTAHRWKRIGGATPPRFPTGTFETKITSADLRGTPFPLENAHWETLTFRKDGTWRDVWLHPRRADQPPGEGHYTVRGDVITLVPANPDVLRWSYYRGLLTFKVISDPDAFGSFTYTVHPWRKIR